MDSGRTRQALVVRGGWEGHGPVEATERFIPFLEEHGYAVEVHESLDVYADRAKLAATDLVVQCYTQGVATDEQVLGLSAAVAGGTGLAGWHGGVCDSFRGSPDYLHLTGGQWVAPRRLRRVRGGRRAGEARASDRRGPGPLGAEHRAVLGAHRRPERRARHDHVRRTGRHAVARGADLPRGLDPPVGEGQVFVSTIGHKPEDLDHPDVRTLTERGLLWASR